MVKNINFLAIFFIIIFIGSTFGKSIQEERRDLCFVQMMGSNFMKLFNDKFENKEFWSSRFYYPDLPNLPNPLASFVYQNIFKRFVLEEGTTPKEFCLSYSDVTQNVLNYSDSEQKEVPAFNEDIDLS